MTRGGFPEPIPSLAVLSLPACRRHHGQDDDHDAHVHGDDDDDDADVDCQKK